MAIEPINEGETVSKEHRAPVLITEQAAPVPTPGQTPPPVQPASDNPAAVAVAAVVAADPNLETTTLTLSKDTLEFLRAEAQKRGISTGDMVRLSIGTQKFLSDKTSAGAKIQLRGPEGTFDVAI